MAKDAFNKRRELLTQRMNRKLKNKIIKEVVWSVASIWNVDMEKNGEDKLERQGEKWTGIRDSEGKDDANRRNKK